MAPDGSSNSMFTTAQATVVVDTDERSPDEVAGFGGGGMMGYSM